MDMKFGRKDTMSSRASFHPILLRQTTSSDGITTSEGRGGGDSVIRTAVPERRRYGLSDSAHVHVEQTHTVQSGNPVRLHDAYNAMI